MPKLAVKIYDDNESYKMAERHMYTCSIKIAYS